MEPTNPMSTLLEAVSTVITSFTSWLTTLTTSLIANPIVQLLFAMIAIMVIVRFVIGLVKTSGRFGKSGRKRR